MNFYDIVKFYSFCHLRASLFSTMKHIYLSCQWYDVVVSNLVLMVWDKILLKPAYSATETSLNIDILPVVNNDIKISRQRLTWAVAQVGLCLCWSHATITGFLATRPILLYSILFSSLLNLVSKSSEFCNISPWSPKILYIFKPYCAQLSRDPPKDTVRYCQILTHTICIRSVDIIIKTRR